MFDSSACVQVLKLANINTVEHGEPVQRFRVYFARSLPDEFAMVVVQAAFRDGYINLNPAVGTVPSRYPPDLQAVTAKAVIAKVVKCAAVEISRQLNDLARQTEFQLPDLG